MPGTFVAWRRHTFGGKSGKKEREMLFRVKSNSTRDISLLFLERVLCSQPASCSLLGAVCVFVLLYMVLTLFCSSNG